MFGIRLINNRLILNILVFTYFSKSRSILYLKDKLLKAMEKHYL